MSNTETAADRLAARYASLRLSAAQTDDLFDTLAAARDRVRSLRVTGEDPKAHATQALLAGWVLATEAADRLDARRRKDVMGVAFEWLADVVQLTDTEYRLTIGAWAARARAARQDHADTFRPKVRA